MVGHSEALNLSTRRPGHGLWWSLMVSCQPALSGLTGSAPPPTLRHWSYVGQYSKLSSVLPSLPPSSQVSARQNKSGNNWEKFFSQPFHSLLPALSPARELNWISLLKTLIRRESIWKDHGRIWTIKTIINETNRINFSPIFFALYRFNWRLARLAYLVVNYLSLEVKCQGQQSTVMKIKI